MSEADQLAAIRALIRRYDNRPAAPAVIALINKIDAILDSASTREPEPESAGDIYRALAAERVARWGYTNTLDPHDLATYIDELSQDANLRADVDTVTALVRDQVIAPHRRENPDV